jgi:hypothetical protein
MAYRELKGRALYDYIFNFMSSRPESAFSRENLQGFIIRENYASPTLEEIDSVLNQMYGEHYLTKYAGDLYRMNPRVFEHMPILPPYMRAGHPPEQNIGTQILKALVGHTIDDITYEQMNRIVRRLNRMPESDRNSPVRVGQVIADELGEAKALQYVEKALANGMIKQKEYEALRAAIILRMPREKVPEPWAGAAASQLVAGQRKLQQDLGRLSELGLSSMEKPIRALNKDIERMKRAWGVK